MYIWEHPDWPAFHWDDESLVAALTSAALERGKLLASGAHLAQGERQSLLATVAVQDVSGTSSIEGVNLEPASVRSSVARRLGLDIAGLPAPQRDVDGLVDVLFDATENATAPLTPDRLKAWHAALFPTGYSGMSKIAVAEWRTGPISVQSGPFGQERVHFRGPPADSVPTQMKTFLKWWNGESLKLEGVVRAGVGHLWFETIHPFDDGNGRLGRALADMALARADGAPQRYYSLSRAILSERRGYYAELQRAQGGDLELTRWLLWFVGRVADAVQHSVEQISAAHRKSMLRRRANESGLEPRQLKVLFKLFDAEPVGFAGGLSNANYCKIAKVSKATAARDLAQLVELEFLTRSDAGGRSTRYYLHPDVLKAEPPWAS